MSCKQRYKANESIIWKFIWNGKPQVSYSLLIFTMNVFIKSRFENCEIVLKFNESTRVQKLCGLNRTLSRQIFAGDLHFQLNAVVKDTEEKKRIVHWAIFSNKLVWFWFIIRISTSYNSNKSDGMGFYFVRRRVGNHPFVGSRILLFKAYIQF